MFIALSFFYSDYRLVLTAMIKDIVGVLHIGEWELTLFFSCPGWQHHLTWLAYAHLILSKHTEVVVHVGDKSDGIHAVVDGTHSSNLGPE